MHDLDLTRPLQTGRPAPVRRIAVLSLHTCPLDQPGTGDSGGMNVYVLQVARRLADMGVEVDIFSRWSGISERVREVAPGLRVIHLEAGPAHPIPKEDLAEHVPAFVCSLLRFQQNAPRYDVIHSHYWLSGAAGRLTAERLNVPVVQSFHTLGLVKNATLGPGETPEPRARILAETKIVAAADRVLAPTEVEAAELIRFYRADPARVRVVTPGVDTEVFTPGPARAVDGIDPARPLIVFAGRLQPLKAPDLAIEALAALRNLAPWIDPTLLILGGPSGARATSPPELRALADRLGVGERVVLRDPVPHPMLADIYRAADVVLVPSRTESFGLVALEAAACGTPLVASDVGGLRTAVQDGSTGLLVAERTPEAFARALRSILADPGMREAMGDAGARFARRYDWRRAAAGLLAVYEDVVAPSQIASTLPFSP